MVQWRHCMDGPIPPSLPFRVNTPPTGVRSEPAPRVHIALAPGKVGEVRGADSVEWSPRAALGPPGAKVSRLVAGSVDLPVSFDAGPVSTDAEGALPLYRHPADRNAAATGVTLGRRVDVTG